MKKINFLLFDLSFVLFHITVTQNNQFNDKNALNLERFQTIFLHK